MRLFNDETNSMQVSVLETKT